MKINFVKTHPDAVIPTRGSDGAAGFDLTAVSLKRAADIYIYDTGLALEIPSGYWGGIYARSSIFFTGLEKCGGVCVVDSGYRDSISVIMRRVMSDYQLKEMRGLMAAEYPGKLHLMSPYKVGDRVAQLIIQPCYVPTTHHILHPEDGQNSLIAMEAIKFVEVDALSTTARGCQGYGSTGR